MVPSQSAVRRSAEILLLAAAYYAAGRVGMAMQLPETNSSAIWPAAGVGLAALLLRGYGVWPGIAVAAFVGNLTTLPATTADVAAAAAIAAGKTIEQVAAAWLVRRICHGENPFERTRDAIWFIHCVAACSLVAAATRFVALSALGLFDSGTYAPSLVSPWIGDMAAMIVVTPPLYSWLHGPRVNVSTRQLFEYLTLVATTAMATEILFGGHAPVQLVEVRPFVPLLLWAAFRFGQRETTLLSAVICVQAIGHTWQAAQAPGSPATVSMLAILMLKPGAAPHELLRSLQMFLCATVGIALIVAAAVEERTSSQRALSASEERLREMNRTLEMRIHERTWQLEAANRQLEAHISERERIEARLRTSLDEKETLLREVHHRVKNNLAVVSGLLSLEAAQSGDGSAVHVLRKSQHRIRSMAMVHEKLYRSGDLAAVDFREYLDALLAYLVESYRTSSHVNVLKRFDPLLLDTDTAVPCGLIFTELVTNTLKHAFPGHRSGTVSVELRAGADGRHSLSVIDDGVGLAGELQIEHASSLGWRLVRSLTRQLEGSLVVRPAMPGLEATLQFPGRGAHAS